MKRYVCEDCFWIGVFDEICKEYEPTSTFVYVSCPSCGGRLNNVSRSQYHSQISFKDNEKIVNVECDHSADGVFVLGGSLSPYSLPISRDLAEKIRDLNWAYDLTWPERRHCCERQEESLVGLWLAKCLKEELPDWEVWYFDAFENDRLDALGEATEKSQDYSGCSVEILISDPSVWKCKRTSDFFDPDERDDEPLFPMEVPLKSKGKVLTPDDIIARLQSDADEEDD